MLAPSRRPAIEGPRALLALPVLVLALACGEGSSRLAVTDVASSTGASGGSLGMGGAGSVQATDASTAASGGAGPVEPLGETRVTVVNGVVDEPATRLCFLPYPAGPSGTEQVWPSADGLPFARAASLDLTKDVPPSTDVEVRVVAGTKSAIAGKSCAALVDAPGVRTRSVGVLPAGALSSGRSVLLVTHGCMGGAGHTDPLESLVCGTGYTNDAPNAALAAGYLSRLASPDKVPMQFVHAVAAMSTGPLALAPGVENASPSVVVSEWSLGAILPYPPYLERSRVDLVDVGEATLHIGPGSPAVVKLGEALTNGGLAESDVVDGEGLAFVALGAMPNIPKGVWWSALTVTAVAILP